MAKFESDQKLFQDYVAMIKKKEEKIMIKSEKINVESKNVQQKISNLQNDISNIKSVIEKKVDVLKKLKTYQVFIFQLLNNEAKINEFKQDRIRKLKERNAQNIDVIINHILSSSDISDNDNEIASLKSSSKDNPFKEIHELGLSEQDSDDEYPIFFNDASEVTNIINLLEEQNIAEINLLQDNKSIYDHSMKNLEDIKMNLEKKRLEVKLNLDETNHKIHLKNNEYKLQEEVIQTNISNEEKDAMSYFLEHPNELDSKILDLYNVIFSTKQALQSSSLEIIKDIEEKVESLIKIKEYREMINKGSVEDEVRSLRKKRKNEQMEERKKQERDKLEKNHQAMIKKSTKNKNKNPRN